MSLVSKPPLLVQRCNGTTAGLGYLKVSLDCLCKSPPWMVSSVLTVRKPIGGNGAVPLLT
jgi:hypothetical protein